MSFGRYIPSYLSCSNKIKMIVYFWTNSFLRAAHLLLDQYTGFFLHVLPLRIIEERKEIKHRHRNEKNSIKTTGKNSFSRKNEVKIIPK